MININEKVNYQGELEVFKIYEDGREELHFKDSNVIVSGGVSGSRLGIAESIIGNNPHSINLEEAERLLQRLTDEMKL